LADSRLCQVNPLVVLTGIFLIPLATLILAESGLLLGLWLEVLGCWTATNRELDIKVEFPL
jgi:hypothetical protein